MGDPGKLSQRCWESPQSPVRGGQGGLMQGGEDSWVSGWVDMSHGAQGQQVSKCPGLQLSYLLPCLSPPWVAAC